YAYERGPLVYCAEGTDNGGYLDTLYIPRGATCTAANASALSTLFRGGIKLIRARGNKVITLIPYFARAYRGISPMKVWLPGSKGDAEQEPDYIDRVVTCDTQSEASHNLRGENMRTGTDLGWRDALNGWISYDMDVLPDKPIDLVIRQWGSDGGERHYNILCDNTTFSYDHVDNFLPNQYYFMHHPIPYELTKGKTRVTIKMQSASANDIVGGLYGVYTAVSENVPEETTVTDYLWTSQTTSRSRHAYTSNGGSGTFRNRTWMDGSGTVGQRWKMKVNPGTRNYLMVLYWGGESDLRDFEVYCDNALVGTERLIQNCPGRFLWGCYMIPEETTSGKEYVFVRLTSPTGTKTGGIFYAYTLSYGGETDVNGLPLTTALPSS
ncbi:MAG: hypothetical protein HUK03_10560, partial [Bacteroidaceae bacterium]|nr:hypothetical protein [Bacteroidaceae bacterium]